MAHGSNGAALVVAVAAERVMVRAEPFYLRQRRRTQMKNRARDLARSGECASHHEVISRLMASDDPTRLRELLEDRGFCAQLDKLCAIAQMRRLA